MRASGDLRPGEMAKHHLWLSRDSTVGGFKGDGINYRTKSEQWRGVGVAPRLAQILKSPPMTICTIANAEYRH